MIIDTIGIIFGNRTLFFSDKFFPSANIANEALLYWEVFINALQCLETYPQDTEEYQEDEAWVKENDQEWPFSFLRLCQNFNIETESLRQCLLASKP